MEKIGDIEIRVVEKSGNSDLSPETYDIRNIASILQNVEDLLYPNNKKNHPIITYSIEDGPVRHICKTSIQTVICFPKYKRKIVLITNCGRSTRHQDRNSS